MISTISIFVLCFLIFAGLISLTRPSWLGGQSFSQIVWGRNKELWLLVCVSVVTACLLVQSDKQFVDAISLALWCFVMGHWFWRE